MSYTLWMSSRREHDEIGGKVGVIAGVLSAWLRGDLHEPLDVLAAAAGGYCGGRFGSILPDVFEPATSPNHRSTMHSVVVTSAIVAKGGAVLMDVGGQVVASAQTRSDRMLRVAAASALAAAPIGYASHVVADSETPAGVPILTRGL